MHKINIKAKESYNILIGKNLLQNACSHLSSVIFGKSIIIVYDSNVEIHLQSLLSSFKNSEGYHISVIKFKTSERKKSINEAVRLCAKIMENKVDRKTTIIALGGGILGDIVGFCASIILRGLRFILIPTTLLSQVDSAIGGKTGVNTSVGKNTIGTFYQPKMVLIDTNTLTTLKVRDYISGYAECLKYALLFDREYFYYLHKNISKVLERDQKFLQEIIVKSCKYKAKIVALDEFETKDIRALLNLGHTFAHAFEKYNDYKNTLTHGEAVAIGLVLAFDFAYYLGQSKDNSLEIKKHLKLAKLPTKIKKFLPNIDINQLIIYMKGDKKNYNNTINMVLPKEIGSCVVTSNVGAEKLEEFLKKFLK